MLPYLEVAHLASSSSFYSAILQPLDLRYIPNPKLETASSLSAVGPCITYGVSVPQVPIFQLRQVGNPRPSRIVLTAQSPAAVAEFHRFALRANPDIAPLTITTGRPAGAELADTQEERAKMVDFDGNTIEVVYRPSPSDHPSRYGGSTVRKTQSTSTEANRILNWNYGVAASSPPTVVRSRAPVAPSYAPDDEPYRSLRRSVTTTSVIYDPIPSPRQNSNGLSAGAVVGTLLGVAAGAAAGAAITYSMVKNDRARAPRQEFDVPTFARRSTFPAAPYSADQSPRYAEVERTVEKVRYPYDYPPVDPRRPQPEYIARYSQVGGNTKGSARELEDLYDDRRSRHSSHHSRSGASVRTRSEAATARRPLLITETEHRSYVGSSSSKYGNTPPITRSSIQRSHTFDVSDRESYASARSQRSQSTIRPPPPPEPLANAPLSIRSRAGSRGTTTTIKMPNSSQMSGSHSFGRAASYISARHVPLPASGVGSSLADWDDDSSVVPDDSISCVGSRRSGRSYHG